MILLILILIAVVIYNQGVAAQAHNARIEREYDDSSAKFEQDNDK